jgi:hypothetical protein
MVAMWLMLLFMMSVVGDRVDPGHVVQPANPPFIFPMK